MTQIDFDTVLSDDDWLRRIARRLVGDSNTADDLAQEAWLAAHESGRGVGASRPWLAGVVRNAGFRVFRTQRRERDRVERAVDAGETTSPATDEIVEALQLRERAARELLELEEPYRRAVYLVYVSDLSISEAARREGVATSTMSVRVQSGIAKLRARMDDAYGGDRRAWAGVLLPMAAPHRAATGAAAMIAWGVVAATVILGLVGLWVRGVSGDGDSAIAAPQVENTSSAGGPVELASVAPRATRDAAGSSVPGTAALGSGGRSARLVGRFLWPNGEPAAGAYWSLRAWGRNERATAAFGELDEWEEVTGTLDADGRFAADFEPPVAAQFSFYVGDRDRARASWRWHGIRAGETRDVGTMTLHPVGIVTGRIVDPDGRPVVGMRLYVEIDEYEFEGIGGRSFNTTGSQVDPATGTFRIESVPAGRTTLVALALGHRRVSDPRRVLVRAGEEVDVELAVDGVDDLAETVVVHVGCRPHQISRALDRPSVRLIDQSGYEHVGVASSRVSQSFEFEDVGAGPHVVRVEHAGFHPWERVGVEPGDIVRARLEGNAAIELDVRDPSGAPVSEFSVDVEGRFGPGRGDTWRAHAGREPLPDGRVTGLVPGDWRLVVDADEGMAEISIDGLTASETRVVTVPLVETASVRGAFLRPDGGPVAGIDVRLCRPAEVDDSSRSRVLDTRSQTNRPERARLTVDRTVTDADGRYRLRAPGAGRYVVVAFPLGAHQLDSSYVDVDASGAVSGIDFVVPLQCSVSGRIEFPPYLDPAGWSIQVAIDGKIGRQRSLRNRPAVQPDGRFSVSSLPSGRATLYVYQPDASDAWGPDPPTDAYLVSEFDLSAGQVVDRTFEWPDPAPMILTVELDVPIDLAPPERTFLTGQRVQGRIPRADGAGPTLDPIIAAALDYGIASRGRDWLFWQPAFVSATEGEVTRTLSIDVERRRLRVMIDGTPQPGAEVRLSVVSEDFLGTTVTADAEGWLDIGLSPATYRFKAWRRSAELAWPPPSGQTELRLD